jgi:16S rRNA (guanine966-N2)-methyltransferase
VTRIIAGIAGGRRLVVPSGVTTRPTSSRAREGLFATLTVLRGGSLAGLRMLDLYAGSGAVSCEALSRGAHLVTCVELDRAAVRAIRINLKNTGIPGATVIVGRVDHVVVTAASRHHDVAYLDPPYAVTDEQVGALLVQLAEHDWLVDGAVVVVERSRHGNPFPWPPGYHSDRLRSYGEAQLWYGYWYGAGHSVPE